MLVNSMYDLNVTSKCLDSVGISLMVTVGGAKEKALLIGEKPRLCKKAKRP